MRHYEIVFLVHPDQSNQVPAMIAKYKSIVEDTGGRIHRLEDWGRRQMCYLVDDIHKAHYVLMNIECIAEALEQLNSAFRFSDAVIRSMVIRRDRAIVEQSPLMKSKQEEGERERHKNEASAAVDTTRDTVSAAESADVEVSSEGSPGEADVSVDMPTTT